MPSFRRSGVLPVVILAILLLGLALRDLQTPTSLAGHAAVVDGDTIRLGGRRVRLLGLDAPELGQSCTDQDGAEWRCGEVARTHMAALLGAGEVACAPTGDDRYGRLLAHCTAGGEDISRAEVRAGLAVSDGDYLADEMQARAEKAGIWQGNFVLPAQWRREHAAEAEPSWFETIKAWFR